MDPAAIQQLKLAVGAATGLSKDALHIYVGLVVLFVTALLLRRPLRSALPWAAVFLVAALGEIVDLSSDFAAVGRGRWGESLHDLLNTILWPSVITLLARFTPLFGARSPG